jgi:hypothetical protein
MADRGCAMPPEKNRKPISKWQIASARVTDLRWQIQNALVDNFTEDDMKSEKYQQLMETVDLLMDHVLEKYREEKNKKIEKEMEKLRKQASIFSWRNIAIAVGSAIVGGFGSELGTWLFDIISSWLGFGAGEKKL